MKKLIVALVALTAFVQPAIAQETTTIETIGEAAPVATSPILEYPYAFDSLLNCATQDAVTELNNATVAERSGDHASAEAAESSEAAADVALSQMKLRFLDTHVCVENRTPDAPAT